MNKVEQFSRRTFFNKISEYEIKKVISSSRALNPLSRLSKQLRKSLPPIESEVLFLNRSSFGIRPNDYNRIKSIGIENYLEEQLDYQQIDNSELELTLASVYPLVALTIPELVAYIQEGNAQGEDRVLDAAIQLISTTMLRQIYSPQQLFEVMVEFWTNHFNTDIAKGLDLIFKTHEDREIIRPHSLGGFRQLLQADAKSSTMMFYLDNHTNTKFGPNENYARELMELHTLGVGGGYSEDDVKEVARCFTGWSIGENEDGYFQFYQENHDFNPKTVLGNNIDNSDGIKDGEQVLDILADSSSTASFIAKKLVRRFVSDNPDIQLVRSVAKSFLSTDGDIKSMLRTIFHSTQFLSSVDDKFKRPIEFVSSMFRAIDAESSHTTVSQKFEPLRILIDEYETGGQTPFLWAPPTGYPDVESYWANASSLLRQINLTNGVALAELPYYRGNGFNRYSDYIDYDYEVLFTDINTASEVIDTIESAIIYREMLENDRQVLIDFLLTEGEIISEQRIRAVIGIVLSSTYFVLR
jgi:hypothetical protein